MPDNVSLTTADINNIKNIQGRALIRLNAKNFNFNANGTIKTLPIIADALSSAGLQIFAASVDTVVKKNPHSIVIDNGNFSCTGDPCIIVSLSGDSNVYKYQLTATSSYTSSTGKISVNVFTTKTLPKNGLKVTLNVLLIGYQ